MADTTALSPQELGGKPEARLAKKKDASPLAPRPAQEGNDDVGYRSILTYVATLRDSFKKAQQTRDAAVADANSTRAAIAQKDVKLANLRGALEARKALIQETKQKTAAKRKAMDAAHKVMAKKARDVEEATYKKCNEILDLEFARRG